MQRKMRRLFDPLDDEAAVRLQHGPAAPIFDGATDPVARRCDHFTTDEIATLNRNATDRQLSPVKTADTTRSRRSFERGRAIRCWPPSQRMRASEPPLSPY